MHPSELGILPNAWCALRAHPITENCKTTKLTPKLTSESNYTAGEGFLTSCAKILTNLSVRFPETKTFSTSCLRLRVPLAEGNVLVSKILPEGALVTLREGTLGSFLLVLGGAERREEPRGREA